MNLAQLPWKRYASTSGCALAGAALFAAAPALAQTANPALGVHRAPSASKHAGIYHAATGTWTRRPATTFAVGPDTIYNNSASSAYFSTAGSSGGFGAGGTNFDEGGIPTTANTTPFAGTVDRDVYTVNGFVINYCDFNPPATSGWEVSFYESYTPCTNDTNAIGTSVTTGLPAAGGCWTIQVDLSGGQEFQLTGDGGDGFQGDVNTDSFGWSFTYAGTGTADAGFFLAADPAATDSGWSAGTDPLAGTGTYYGGPSACPNGSTGYLTQDLWWLEDPAQPANSGCYFFGGYQNNNGCGGAFQPYASWYLEVFAEGNMEPMLGTNYCMSTPNSTGAMTELTATGSDFASDDNVRLLGSNMAVGSLGIFITSQTQGFVANPGGSDGNLCLVGEVGRFLQNAGQLKVSDSMGEISLDSAIGEWTLGSIPVATPPFVYSATAGMTTNFQLWHRDIGGSNFSNGLSITWQ